MKNYTQMFLATFITAAQLAFSANVLAVGGGLQFEVEESEIVVPGVNPPLVNLVTADSLNFTYHACTRIGGLNNRRLKELGYFWISSYQDKDSVVDSQLNHILANGYHIYGNYSYQARQIGTAQPTISGNRLNYQVSPLNASFQLFSDPLKDTQIEIQDCQVIITGNDDDIFVGNSMNVAQGEKSEADGLANGDFKVVFSNWVWSVDALDIFNAVEPNSLEDFNFLVFNGNLTSLGGALGVTHTPEGSGNLFWLDNFIPINPND